MWKETLPRYNILKPFLLRGQASVLFVLWNTLPDFPQKNSGIHYFRILKTTLIVSCSRLCGLPWLLEADNHLSCVTPFQYAVTEPVLIQRFFLIAFSSLLTGGFWGVASIILGETYGYDSFIFRVFVFLTPPDFPLVKHRFEIGLFALVGLLGVACAPLVGHLVDRILPWVGILAGILFYVIGEGVFTAAAGVSVVAFSVVIFSESFLLCNSSTLL